MYTLSDTVVPLKAEAGLSSSRCVQPKLPLTPSERIIPRYPDIDDLDLIADETGQVPSDFDALDSEGRALVIDFGLFVLINTYCPNLGSEERMPFKMNYHRLLRARIEQLIAAGREVILLGDINIVVAPIDHCDGHLPSVRDTFWDDPHRKWLRDLLDPGSGIMVDAVRRFWPERKGMCVFVLFLFNTCSFQS